MFPQMGGADVFSEQDLRHYADAYRGRDRLRGGFEQYRTLLADGRENKTALAQHNLSMPVLDVVAGVGGQSAETWTRLRDHADDLTVLTAPTGHFVAEQDPQWFLSELHTFLEKKL